MILSKYHFYQIKFLKKWLPLQFGSEISHISFLTKMPLSGGGFFSVFFFFVLQFAMQDLALNP